VASESFLPFGTSSAIGFVPFACSGKWSLSVSVACWLSVPGSTRLSLVCSPTPRASAASATTITSHTSNTGTRRRVQKPPSQYRKRVNRCSGT
jgi:hypothetical protein